MGVSSSTAGYWRTGERKPNPEDRDRLKDRYSIPVEAWDEPPAKMGRPKGADTEAAPAAPSDEPALSEPAASSEPKATFPARAEVNLDATLQTNAVRLNRMILSDIARLEGKAGADLELGKRAEILKKLSDAQVSLAKATGETTLTIDRIAAHPEFKRCVRIITDALAAHPAALRDVGDALRPVVG